MCLGPREKSQKLGLGHHTSHLPSLVGYLWFFLSLSHCISVFYNSQVQSEGDMVANSSWPSPLLCLTTRRKKSGPSSFPKCKRPRRRLAGLGTHSWTSCQQEPLCDYTRGPGAILEEKVGGLVLGNKTQGFYYRRLVWSTMWEAFIHPKMSTKCLLCASHYGRHWRQSSEQETTPVPRELTGYLVRLIIYNHTW